MSYQSQADLMRDMGFNARLSACLNEQALVFRNDARPEFVSLAEKVLTGDPYTYGVWQRVVTGDPNFSDARPEEVTDGALLATVQANWEVVAGIVVVTP